MFKLKLTADIKIEILVKTVRHTVITNCTNRKLFPVTPLLRAVELGSGEARTVCQEWFERVAKAPFVASAKGLYAGRTFREAELASNLLDARLMVVSAGLGLVDGCTQVPSYSLTLMGPAEDAVLPKMGGRSAEWWSALSALSPFNSSVNDGGLILAALSGPYLEMVAANWSEWPTTQLSRLRLFTKEAPANLANRLRSQCMPYDDRLDQIPGGYAGTQSDFAQRALRHFAERFVQLPGDATTHAKHVADLMSSYTPTMRPDRPKKLDAEIVELILRDWDLVDGRSGEMLKHLRRHVGVACEQGRFKTLFKSAATLRQGALL